MSICGHSLKKPCCRHSNSELAEKGRRPARGQVTCRRPVLYGITHLGPVVISTQLPQAVSLPDNRIYVVLPVHRFDDGIVVPLPEPQSRSCARQRGRYSDILCMPSGRAGRAVPLRFPIRQPFIPSVTTVVGIGKRFRVFFAIRIGESRILSAIESVGKQPLTMQVYEYRCHCCKHDNIRYLTGQGEGRTDTDLDFPSALRR